MIFGGWNYRFLNNGCVLKDTRPSPPDNGEIEEKLRTYGPPPGMKTGELAIKLAWKKEWMDRR
jgi:hypothetical protein